jgi:hypothetical protein
VGVKLELGEAVHAVSSDMIPKLWTKQHGIIHKFRKASLD